MSKDIESKIGSNVYAAIMNSRLSERDRQVALNALANANAIVSAILWVTKKIEHLGDRLFLKPSLKH